MKTAHCQGGAGSRFRSDGLIQRGTYTAGKTQMKRATMIAAVVSATAINRSRRE